MPSHCSLLTAKYSTLCRRDSLAVQEVFNGRYQIGKETGRKQRLKGDLAETNLSKECILFPLNVVQIPTILKYVGT